MNTHTQKKPVIVHVADREARAELGPQIEAKRRGNDK